MKAIAKYFLVIIVLTIATFGLLRALWSTTNKKMLNVFIVDKSVKSMDRNEHKSFVWILNNQRYVLPNMVAYKHKEDYFGFFPVDLKNELFDFKSYRINEIDTYASTYDMAYFSDCYGVYSFEWYKGKTKSVRSQKVLGGLNQNDYLLMLKMLENKKLVIAEYNIFGTPTNSLIRSKTESLLGITWSGWAARYYKNLNTNAPNGPEEWMKNLFESQHMGVWPNDGAGIIMLSNDGVIELLLEGVHLERGMPSIVTEQEVAQKYGVSQNVPFSNWFEIANASNNTVLSQFYLQTTSEGNSILARHGLSNSFPAVIKGNGEKNFYYFCGDFADNPTRMFTAKISGGRVLNNLITRVSAPNESAFFNNYYLPLTSSILNNYYSTLGR